MINMKMKMNKKGTEMYTLMKILAWVIVTMAVLYSSYYLLPKLFVLVTNIY